ncbi:unnamed protein product [Rotaria sordida]|uniref:Uncharacterized protein n=1 Tax=Rotaria sordida TaxID=392033 RepID=A0A813VJJ5_9BILA|nr:unnamed protein product [Rotaria sordida]
MYKSVDRSVKKTTLMEIYDLKNNISLEKSIDQRIFNSFYVKPYLSPFNISLDRAKDGFFAKLNYTFIQFIAGLDILEVDSIKQFVTILFIISLLLPGLIAFIAVIFIIKRQCSKRNISSYDIIQD